jgi:hypothetical protein
MVHWLWVPVALCGGVVLGLSIMALCAAATTADTQNLEDEVARLRKKAEFLIKALEARGA